MSKYNSEFYYSILKAKFKKEGENMSEREYPKQVSLLNDGLYEAVLTRVTKHELKDGRGSYLDFYFKINDTEYEYGQFLSEKTEFIVYRDFLIPLGQYASKRGIEDCLKLKDLYVQFEKQTNGNWTNIIFRPLAEIRQNAPVGSKNVCIDSKQSVNTVQQTESVCEDIDEDIPY